MALPAVAALSSTGNATESQTAATPVSIPTLPTSATIRVKQERPDDAEINELAAKMVEANKAKMAAAQAQAAAQAASRPMAAQPVQPGQTNTITNYMTRKNQVPEKKVEPEKAAPALDEDSQKGKFGWTTLGKVSLPYINRGGEKYLAVRMVESKLLSKYLNSLHLDIYNCTCVRSYYITEHEAKLFIEINQKHCEYQFGREPFNTKDLVVRLQDASEFYTFLDICYNKLLLGTSDPKDKCGFVRINGESVVPYTLWENRKYVPLFYFEGETDNLKLRAEKLEGWDLAYLKFCCKVQGIRNELFASETCSVISLDDIKSYFPPGTLFEDYWPHKVVDNQLLLPGNKSSGVPPGGMWTKQPPATPPGQLTKAVTPRVSTPQQVATHQMSLQQSQSPLQNMQQMHFQQLQQMQQSQHNQNQQRNAVAMPPSTTISMTNGWSGLVGGQASYQPQQSQISSRLAQQTMTMHNINSTSAAARTSYNSTARSRNSAQYYPQVTLSMASTQANHISASQPPPLVRATASGSTLGSSTYTSSANVLSMSATNPSTMHLMGMPTNTTHQPIMPSPSQLPHYNASHQQSSQSTTLSSKHPPPLVHINGTTTYTTNHTPGTFPSDIIDLSSPPQSPLSRAVTSRNVNGNSNTVNTSSSNVSNNNVSNTKDPSRLKRLIPIPDHTISGNHIPYQVQKALVESKMVPCINFKPYIYTELLMTLPDLVEHFFPTVSVSKCQKTLQEVLACDLFQGNRQQMAMLKEAGKCQSTTDTLPLIQVRDVMQFMPQMKYIYSNMSNNQSKSDESAAKRQRTS